MDYITPIIVSIIGGGIVVWTSASNMGSPLDKPMIFYKIDPMYFIGAGFVTPGFVGFKTFGFIGIIGALVVVWLSSVVIGNSIFRKRQ